MTDNGAAEKPRALVSDRVYGAVAVIAIILALWFMIRGGESDTTVERIPRLTVEAPTPGATLAQPVTVTFNARTELRPDGSSAAGTRHVHARVGTTELMPGPTDVQLVSGTTYRWTLPRLPHLPAGPAALRLFWSDAAHKPVPGTETDSLSIVIR